MKAFEGNVNLKVDLSNYATKSDTENISHADTSSFALKTNLVSLKFPVLVTKLKSRRLRKLERKLISIDMTN